MALKLNDRVKETSTTTGTGTLNLSGAVSGFQTFVAGVGDGNTTYYAIVNRDESEWETGIGTVTDASTDTLARTTVIASSNSDSAVCDFADISFTSATISAQAAVIYNSSTVSGLTTNAAVAVLDFGAVKTSTSGTFTITFPAAEATAAILRIA